ncbi:hypothetical protein Bbelb_333170 [Branchiostoma belcheri]|nr:hypothetical protein Bbelb_333170 [Branchiostoma belcheri]
MALRRAFPRALPPKNKKTATSESQHPALPSNACGRALGRACSEHSWTRVYRDMPRIGPDTGFPFQYTCMNTWTVQWGVTLPPGWCQVSGGLEDGWWKKRASSLAI